MSKKRKLEPNYRVFQSNGCGDNGLSAKEKELKKELEDYRETHKKPWYL